jgi:hypothetical protein
MNKILKSFVIAAVAVIALVSVGSVFAQSTNPEAGVPGTQSGLGNGYRGSREARGGMQGDSTLDGVMHEAMLAVFAEELGIPAEELEVRLDAGEKLGEIAISTGMTVEDFKALMTEVRATALDKAVEDGLITSEQAEWMKTRGAGKQQVSGRRANGSGQFGTGDCPND